MIGFVVRQWLKNEQLEQKLHEKHATDALSAVLGSNISRYTTQVEVRNHVMHVTLSSAMLRNNLTFSKKEIVAAINRHVGATIITDITFK